MMTLAEAIQIAQALGLFSGGLGLLKWGLTVEKRMTRLELKTGIER